jgi:hypothetical protein
MTYHGGVEDGKSYSGARILRIIRDATLTPQDKLDEIEQYCLQIVDDDTRRWALSGVPSAQVLPKLEPFDYIEEYHEMTNNE